MFNRLLKKDASFDHKTLDFAFDVKAAADSTGEFEGYASVHNVVDQGGDAVQPGAFIPGLAKAKAEGRLIPMLWQHDRHQPIGVWDDISEDSKGLYVKGRLLAADVPQARTALALLKAKALGGMSIGYRIPAGGAAEDPKRRGVFLLKQVDLIEVSLVTMPMLIQAKVTAVKNIIGTGNLPTEREFDGALRELGFSRAKAAAIASAAKSHLLREPEAPTDTDRSDRFAASLASALAGVKFG